MIYFIRFWQGLRFQIVEVEASTTSEAISKACEKTYFNYSDKIEVVE